MHNIAKEESIVFYDFGTRKSMIKTRDVWIKYLAQTLFSKCIFPIGGIDPNLMNLVQVTGNDLCAVHDMVGGRLVRRYMLRPYLFYEENSGRVIDPRYWLPEILTERCTIYYTWKRYWYPPVIHEAEIQPPGYRKVPVPGCGKKRNRYKRYLRHVSTMNECRLNSDPEMKAYVRPARRPGMLPFYYDDIPRNVSRSWKNHGKFRHQWEKNLR